MEFEPHETIGVFNKVSPG